MRASSLAWLGIGAVCAAAVVASCAKGSSDTSFHQVGGGTASSPGTAGGAPTTTTTTRDHATSSSAGAGGFGTTTTTEGSGGGGAGGGGDCSAPTPCTGATLLNEINGDDTDNPDIQHGTTSAWFKVLIKESVSSVFSYPDVSYAVSLVSPTSDNFDVFVYEGDDTSVSCQASPIHGFGSPEQVHDCWTDSAGSNDDHFILVEVRHISGPCDGGSQWTLTITGNVDNGSCP